MSNGSQSPMKNIGKDAFASVVVFLVAIPLCMGIAIASGAPPSAGLISGIIGGIVVGTLAGSPLQVSGPAAGLAVIVFDLIQRFGFATTGMIVLIAGGIQLLAGVLRIGLWFRAVSPAVVHGMLAGIGISIFASQMHLVVDDVPAAKTLTNLTLIPVAIWKAIVPLVGSSHQQAALAGASTLAALMAWKAWAPKRFAFLPAPLIGVVVVLSSLAFSDSISIF